MTALALLTGIRIGCARVRSIREQCPRVSARSCVVNKRDVDRPVLVGQLCVCELQCWCVYQLIYTYRILVARARFNVHICICTVWLWVVVCTCMYIRVSRCRCGRRGSARAPLRWLYYKVYAS